MEQASAPELLPRVASDVGEESGEAGPASTVVVDGTVGTSSL